MTTLELPATDYTPTLPGHYFYDPSIFALEQERIFSASWVCVGRADAIPAVGDYVLATVGTESVIVLRDRAGTLRAFLNVCRHRGARLCTAERGQLRATIQCRYHAWTYALDGKLVGAPNMKEDARFDPDLFGLVPVALENWEGLIFLNLGESPRPLAEQGNILHPRLARYHLGELKVGGTLVYDLRSNWKIVIANYEECAHCALVHPELSAQVPDFRAGLTSGGIEDGAEFAEGIESLTPTGKTSRPLFRDLLPEERHRYYGMVLRPNVFLDLHPDYVVVSRIEPLAPDRTRIVSDLLFDPDVMARPDFDPSDAMEFTDLVSKQDAEVCELSQLGATSRGFRDGGVYGPNERHIRDFDDYVLAMLGQTQQVSGSYRA